MDHSESLQFNCTESSFGNPQTCTKSGNKRATPRKIPGVSKRPERGFLVTDRELLGGKKKPGSIVAREMLGQLRRDFEPDKHGNPSFAQQVHEGHYWVAYSITYWQQQLDITRGEARTGIQCLIDSGCAVIGVFEYGFQPEYLHFRLTEKTLGYVPATPGEEVPQGTGYALQSTPHAVQNTPYAPQSTAKTPNVTPNVTPNDTDPVPNESDTTSIPEISQMQTGEVPTPKAKSTSTPDAVKEVPKFSKVVGYWVEEKKKYWPDHDVQLKTRQPKIIRDMRNKLEAPETAIDWRTYLSLVMHPGHWHKVCTGAPACPTPEFMSAHLSEFVAYYRQNNPEALAAAAEAEAESHAAYLAKLKAEGEQDKAKEPSWKGKSTFQMTPEEHAEWKASLKPMYAPVPEAPAVATQSTAEPTPAPDVHVPTSESAQPTVEPVVIIGYVLTADDSDDERPLTEAEKEAALAKWLAPAMQQHQAETDAKKVADSKKRITAAVTMPQAKKATMFQKKAA